MKKFNRLVAAICTIAMLLGSMQIFGGVVNASDNEVSRTKTITLMNNTFDSQTSTLPTHINGATGGSVSAENGYLEISPNWGIWGIRFDEGALLLSDNTSVYHFNFDLKSSDTYQDVPMMTLINYGNAATSGVGYGMHFPFVRKSNNTDNKITLGTRGMPASFIYADNSWYNFDITIAKVSDSSWDYDIVMTDSTGESVTFGDADWNLAGFNNGLDIDGIGFAACGTICLDNLLIEKIVPDTSVPEVVDGVKTIFNLDFDTTNQNVVNVGGGNTSSIVIEKDSTGNKYVKIEDNWNLVGYKFNNGSIDVEDYNSTFKISYDFKLGVKNDYTTWGNITLSNREYNKTNKGIGTQYPLLRACSEAGSADQFAVFGRVIPGAIYSADNWYSLDLEFKASEDNTKWEYDLTITNKANTQEVASLCTYNGENGGGAVIPSIGDIDMFVFGAGGITSLDNILVQSYTPEEEEEEEEPVVGNDIIYSNDFVTGSATPERWNSVSGGTASTTNGYLEISPAYGIYGYEFSTGKSISLDDSNSVYKISFDMKSTGTDTGTVMVALTDKTFITTPLNGINKAFPLMTRLSSETIKIGTRNMPTRMAYAENTWYNFNISIKKVSDSSWNYNIVMTDGNGATQTFSDSDWNLAGFNGDGDITAIVFAGANSICIDNLKIEKITYPVVENVVFKDAQNNEIVYPDSTVKSIDITFSEPMKEASLQTSVTLSGLGEGGYSGALSTDGLVYTITLNEAFVVGNTYTLAISTEAEALSSGNKLQEAYSKVITVSVPQFTAELINITIGESTVDTLANLVNGAANVNVYVSNTTNAPASATVIVAYYNSTEQMIDIDTYPLPVGIGEVTTIPHPITIAKTSDTAKVRVMLWDSVSGLYPYSAPLVY